MRIHSKFKDYYDSASAYGVDMTIHYAREEGVRLIDDLRVKPVLAWPGHPGWPSGGWAALIGFCGYVYPLIYVNADPLLKAPWNVSHFFYDYREYREFRRKYKAPDYPTRRRYRSRRKERSPLALAFENGPHKDDDLFVALNSPLFVMRPGEYGLTAYTNCKLGDWGFAKVKDPATAFQEIQFYLTNQLVKERPVEEIADKYRIAQHGFDRFSFRHPIKL